MQRQVQLKNMHLVFETIGMVINLKTCQPFRCIAAESAAEPAQISKKTVGLSSAW